MRTNMYASASPPQRAARLHSIDMMRGVVMLIMTLDHLRETFFLRWQVSDPMDVAHTEPALFFSRVAAHFCAPMFIFLTGLSAWLYANPPTGPRSATGFLLKRGVFLIVLEVLVVSIAWTGAFPPPTISLQVIWAIGLSMIALALLHHLPRVTLMVTGLAIVFGHNLLTPISFPPDSSAYVPWTILHDRGFLIDHGPTTVRVSYPLLPWIGVIALGYAVGPWYAVAVTSAQRRKMLVTTGVGALALLLVLRAFNLYGETLDWVNGETAVRTLMSFLNVTKYPPSLAFLLLTLGGGLIVLGWLEQRNNALLRACETFGGVPMFYYLLHLFVLLGLQLLSVRLFGANNGPRFDVESLWMVWVLTATLIPLLYWPCKAFGKFKRQTTVGWVRYL